MKMKKLLGVFLAFSLIGSVSTAQAIDEAWLAPANPDGPTIVNPGDTFELTLHINFDTYSLGGGLDIFYDSSMLSFVSFVFDSAFMCPVGCPTEPLLSREGDDLPGELNGVGFSSFAGFSGEYFVGVLTMQAGTTAGLTTLTMADNDTPAGYWVDGSTGGQIPFSYRTSDVLVTPLPAAAWLMLAGIGFLVGFGRRKMGISA